MRVGVNVALGGIPGGFRQTGVSRYITELTAALPGLLGEADELVLLGDSLAEPVQRSPVRRILWEQATLPSMARAAGVDLLHCPVNVAPLFSDLPCVVTIHDLAFLKISGHVTRRRRAWLTAATRRSALRARHVITVSESTRADVIEWLGLPDDRVTAIPLAMSPRIRRLSAEELRAFREDHHVERPYILTVGTLEPRKNLPLLLRAFSQIADSIDHQLVLVGPEGWLTGELKDTLAELSFGERVRLTGFVSDEQLGGWYSGATLAAFPSLYEGFGLPLLEAMYCGVPVIASDSSSFPEVAGGASLLVPPNDEQAWGDGLRELVENTSLREDLSARGMARASQFSWEGTAARTLDVYSRAGSRS